MGDRYGLARREHGECVRLAHLRCHVRHILDLPIANLLIMEPKLPQGGLSRTFTPENVGLAPVSALTTANAFVGILESTPCGLFRSLSVPLPLLASVIVILRFETPFTSFGTGTETPVSILTETQGSERTYRPL